jgi:hypothetical protein
MSEVQILAIALSPVPTMVVVLTGVLINNARLNDVRDLLRVEMKLVESGIERNHSEMLHRFGDLDTRLSRIENALGMKPNG